MHLSSHAVICYYICDMLLYATICHYMCVYVQASISIICCIYRHNPLKIAFKEPLRHCGREVSFPALCYIALCYRTFIALLSASQLFTLVLEMFQQKMQELELELSSTREECSATSERLARVSAQEAALVQQNARMSVELAAGDKTRKELETKLGDLRTQLASREAEIADTKEELKSAQAKQKTVTKCLQKELDEKSRLLQEYQQKVSVKCACCSYYILCYYLCIMHACAYI